MKTYLVGGAVRDKLLGLPVKERDWVVVGATPEQMRALGFKQVGKDFPVFLHPDTGEEYALARTERKTGPGYTGFEVHAAPDVTLEQDLERRDLTINAMAEDEAGNLIDPFGGERDLREGVLRHVSPAFAEDPVRILRVARLAARYGKWGFRVAHATDALMRRMVEDGEADTLVPERVWAESEKALAEDTPARFFEVLRSCGALARIFPEIDALFGVPQPERHHGEGDAAAHALLVLDQAVRLSPDPRVRFAALTHDLGKGATPEDQWPRHLAHEERGAVLIERLCERLRVPNEYRDLALLAARHHHRCHRAFELRPGTVLDLLQAVDAFRRPERFAQLLRVCEADARGRQGRAEAAYPQAELLRRALAAAREVDGARLAAQGLEGPQIAERLRQERTAAIKRARSRMP
ncbi:MAG: multifunctional CCA addition/repair protein [Gammaproteobacteria bacterium]|nr:multifunctional CCA addition/repair protein [Gammaproteobacteria bacterium]NIR98618.1 multifunctional CCA addition/repair protein [Gammaproteobacteria bacterium]NIT64341.1 multifunctional CCA addition/repair protein [Gammaproteobacteria bacterium]NIV21265.1 multifunctional CCA addition/repair protein [Gammaproteobacteria bacterium]NIX10969.1 multifunctional CCA addition/repair protein [Gammaproteobacteria bacterium]